LSREYEFNPQTAENMLYLAMTMLMIKRL